MKLAPQLEHSMMTAMRGKPVWFVLFLTVLWIGDNNVLANDHDHRHDHHMHMHMHMHMQAEVSMPHQIT